VADVTTLEKTPLVFTDEDYAFIEREFGLNREAVNSLDDNGVGDLYDECCEIEMAEAGNEPPSERCEMAVRLVDLIHGPYDSTEFDAEMADKATG
jgi:hypothetical protein